MAIRIIKQPDIYLTEAEMVKLRREYEAVCSFMVDPPTFEDYVRVRVRQLKEDPQ